MAGSGVMRLRAARRSPSRVPSIESVPTHPGRYSGAPKVADQYSPSAPKKPGTFGHQVPNTKPKASDRNIDGEGHVSRSAIKRGSSRGK